MAVRGILVSFIRYSLASFCFAASVGSLALWGWSMTHREIFVGPNANSTNVGLQMEFSSGKALAAIVESAPAAFNEWHHFSFKTLQPISDPLAPDRQFYWTDRIVEFPLWYPALVFALAAVGILRIGRFTIRSALIATTIVAALLGMVVAL